MAVETQLPVAVKANELACASEGWRPFDSLRREVDRLFDTFGTDFWGRPFASLDRTRFHFPANPAVDVTETDKAYEITAELPGIEKKNIEVSVASGGLTIKGEKKQESEETDKDYHLTERRYGSFQRYFLLPDGVVVDKIEARFNNGILRLILPKAAEARRPAKKIEIKAA